ncbi:hypothetical protein [Azospirillum canadense]|uniref:hypothetical protein n=1 Tax=Azospirillum canadense TaxID=403962 RepID=UPI002227B055|nr:hypothetical protein [Azospirillum canadense]MCW2243159.1 hypothetical protein [Azospirillum canadense]
MMATPSAGAPRAFSRYLRPLRPERDADLPSRLARRWGVCAAVAGGAGLLAYGTRARWFDPDGPGYAAYWLHDAVYLPLKGHLWTWGLPYSLVPWTVLATLLVTGALGFLSGRPLLRGAHAALTRLALTRPWGAGLLDRWHALTASTPMRARHLELIVERERVDLLEAFDGVPGEPPHLALVARLATATALSTALRLRCDDGPSSRMAVAADLLETVMRVERAATTSSARDARAAVDRLSGLLDECLARDEAQPADGAFSAPALANEARTVARLIRARWTSGQRSAPVALRPLAAAVAERSGRLNALRAVVERRLRGHGGDATAIPPPPPACGRLAALIALATAREADEPDVALAYLDSVSGVDFARGAGLPAEAEAFANAWLAEAPDQPHWRLAALLVGAPSPADEHPTLMTPGGREHLNDPMRRLAWTAGAAETTP